MIPVEEERSSEAESYGDGFESMDDADDLFSESDDKKPKKTEARHEVEQLTLKDTRNMMIWKIVVFSLMLIASGFVGAGTYFFVRKTETEEFEHTYEQYVDTIREALIFRMAGIKESLKAQANFMVTEAAERNQTFPQVTIGSFEVEGLSVRVASKVQGTIFTPLLQSSQDVQMWNNYSVQARGWIERSILEFEASPDSLPDHPIGDKSPDIMRQVGALDGQGNVIPLTREPTETSPVAPWWQTSPPPSDASSSINIDLLSDDQISTLFGAIAQAKEGLFGPISDLKMFTEALAKTKTMDELRDGDYLVGEKSIKHRRLQQDDENDQAAQNVYHPTSIFMQPVFADKYDPQSRMIGVLHAIVQWDAFMINLLPPDIEGIRVILRNDCDQVYTYEIKGHNAVFIGEGEFREEKYEIHEFRFDLPFNSYTFPETTPNVLGHCAYTYSIYPTSEYEAEDRTALPLVLTFIVGGAFFLMAATFAAYDYFSNKRNRKVVDAAAKFNSIVSSLFPENVRERLFADAEEKMRKKENIAAIQSIDDLMISGEEDEFDNKQNGRPIADLFPETSILFADIAGFTAWSSTREPSQVFELLESIYSTFDSIAEKKGVYKVETIGDCYVAVVGLPKPRKDHAVAMVRFARECMNRMRTLTRKLEITLGPDTSMLAMRMGIHSGPVTAGVLRGQRARYQLFGDTMNTAARMESNGIRDKIHVSQETAELLYAAGKSKWLTPREEKIHAKGKGELQTYWVSCTAPTSGSVMTGTSNEASETAAESSDAGFDPLPEKVRRSIKWNTEVLAQILKQLVASRETSQSSDISATNATSEAKDDMVPLDEVAEVITLPAFTATKKSCTIRDLEFMVQDQLKDYVTAIALLHRGNPFHNFEHASHMAMSVVKLLARITDVKEQDSSTNVALGAMDRHNSSFGIASDPMVQLACVFSALIHDADHPGVSNEVLMKEEVVLAQHYKGRSVAEQQSFDLAWSLLMEERYADLRQTIFPTPAEQQRFRQLVVNSVMATDVLDQQLKAQRNNRWDTAFAGSGDDQTDTDTMNRKATMVIEHIIQASDLAHTMQHWHIYRKWNEALFDEMYTAFLQGRTKKDPASFWYEGEISFFDSTVIPLAEKLKDCGVLGVSSDEYLNYAKNNRKEWMAKGPALVEEMVQKYRTQSSRRNTIS